MTLANVVYGEGDAAHFIDWDFAGSVADGASHTYPAGFQIDINDGLRGGCGRL